MDIHGVCISPDCFLFFASMGTASATKLSLMDLYLPAKVRPSFTVGLEIRFLGTRPRYALRHPCRINRLRYTKRTDAVRVFWLPVRYLLSVASRLFSRFTSCILWHLYDCRFNTCRVERFPSLSTVSEVDSVIVTQFSLAVIFSQPCLSPCPSYHLIFVHRICIASSLVHSWQIQLFLSVRSSAFIQKVYTVQTV